VQRQQLIQANLTLQAAEVASVRSAIAAHNSALSNADFRHVTLELSPGKKLGIMIDDNAVFNMPELRGILSDSPARDRIPQEFRRGCCIVSLKSNEIGNTQPWTAAECVRFFSLGQNGMSGPARVEIFLIQTKALPCLWNDPLLGRKPSRPPAASSGMSNNPLPLASGNSRELTSQVPPKKDMAEDAPAEFLAQPTKRKKTDPFMAEQKVWEEQFETLSSYKKLHGHCDVLPSKNPNLAHWVWVQRELGFRGKMKHDQRVKLNEIGFGWSHPYPHWTVLPRPPPHPNKSDNNDDGEAGKPTSKLPPIICKREGSNSCPSKEWQDRQDTLKLQKELQKDKEWQERQGCLKEWQKQYDTLVEYKNRHGHCNVSSSDHSELAQWILVQREENCGGRLKRPLKVKLNKIGFCWASSTFKQRSAGGSWREDAASSKPFEKRCEGVVRCDISGENASKAFGTTQKPTAILPPNTAKKEDGTKRSPSCIDFFGQNDRDSDNENSEMIPKCGSKSTVKEYLTPSSWEERYAAIVRFKKRCGIFPASGYLFSWLEEQKEAIGSSISMERIEKLLEVGVKLPEKNLQNLREQLGDVAFDEWCAKNVNGSTDDEEEEPTDDDGQKKKPNKRRKKSPANSSKVDDQNVLYFWQSPEAANLFGFDQGDDVRKGLQDRIALLRKANESEDGWKSLIPDDGKEDLYPCREIMALRHRALYLAKSYMMALEKMNKQRWRECCEEAAVQLDGLGLTQLTGSTVQRYQLSFRVGNVFPHPAIVVKERQSQKSDRIFEFFPKAKEMFLKIANENTDRITRQLFEDEFAATILPVLERESRDEGCFDDGSPAQKLLVRLLAKPPSHIMIREWMKYLNIEYDEQCRKKYHRQRMQEAWASGMYANRRPKGQGLKRCKALDDEDKRLPDGKHAQSTTESTASYNETN